MRITSVKVGSYGKMKERSFKLSPELNVFYGSNEAGKSTLRSFITTTIFPKAPLKYPAQKGSDSGSVTVTLEKGDELTFSKEGRKSSGLGSEICGIDDKEYISIYSMSPEDLRDVKGIEKGEIRSRFLTIPGGGDIPAAYEAIDSERTALLPDTKRSSRCGIALLIEKEHEASMKVRKLQMRESGDNEYSSLVGRRDALRAEVEQAKSKVKDADDVRSASKIAANRASDLKRIEELKNTERELSYSENTDPSKLSVLEANVANARKNLEAQETETELSRNDLGGRDYRPFIRNREKIERLDSISPDYDYFKKKSEMSETRPADMERPGSPVPLAAGAILIVAGLVVAVASNTAMGAAIAIVGVLTGVLGGRLFRKQQTKETAVIDTESKDRIKKIESLLDEIALDTRIERRSFHADVRHLTTMLSRSRAYESSLTKLENTRKELSAAEEARRLFLEGYGGRENFEKAVRDSRRLVEVRSELSALLESTSGVDTEVTSDEIADSEYEAANEELQNLTKELARTEQALRDISEDMTVEDAITASSDASDAVYAACYRWARLMLEKIILDRASENAYGSHRPDVLSRADCYLSEMTGGRYHVNSDPRLTEIGVIDDSTGENKTVKEWSSGLEDQVKLSMKMAVSLSLSQEKPPVILDDILLTSDSKRKEGACRALASLSEDIQVLYFTCDAETRDLMEKEGATVIDV